MSSANDTNDIENMFFDLLLAANIVQSADNEIVWKHSRNQRISTDQ